MRFLDHARADAQPYFGSETTVAALPVWPAGAAIGGGVADRFVQSSMMLVLGTERLGIFNQKPLRHAVGSFLGHVALTDIDSVFVDKLKFFFKFSQLTLSFKDRSFVSLETRRSFHPQKFAALLEQYAQRGPGSPGPLVFG